MSVLKCAKRLPKVTKEPKDMTTQALKKFEERYQDYLNAMCNEDGYVNEYDRTVEFCSPYFDELEKRLKNET